MEESLFEKIPQLERLLETKSFSELSDWEKEAVTQHITQEEYDSYHELILESKGQFAHEHMTVTPNPEIHRRLLEKMNNRKPHRISVSQMFHKLITFRIPVYQPAFVVVVLAIILFFMNNRSHETIRYIARNDTIYLEKPSPAPLSQINPKLKVATMPPATTVKKDSAKPSQSEMKDKGIIHTHNDQYVANAYQKIHLANLSKSGHTALDDSALMKLLIAAN
jgi:hypothetical protein